jgi:PAS domain S-box-containing protein
LIDPLAKDGNMPACAKHPHRVASWIANIGLVATLCILLVVAWRYQVEEQKATWNNAMWHKLMLNSPVATLIVDADTGAVEEWNPEAEKLFGWTKEEVLHCSFLFLVPAADRATAMAHSRSAATQLQLVEKPARLTNWTLSKKGPIYVSSLIYGVSMSRYFYVLLITPSPPPSADAVLPPALIDPRRPPKEQVVDPQQFQVK